MLMTLSQIRRRVSRAEGAAAYVTVQAAVDAAGFIARKSRRLAFVIFVGYPRRGVVVLSRPRSGPFWTVTPGGALLGARP